MGERISHGSHLGSVLAVRHVLHRPVIAVRIVEVHEVAPRLFVDLAGVDAGREQLSLAGLPDDAVARVFALVDRAEYKRRQAPPGVKITPRAFGRDRRMPITNAYRDG